MSESLGLGEYDFLAGNSAITALGRVFFLLFMFLYVKKNTLSFIPSLQRTRGHQPYLISDNSGGR